MATFLIATFFGLVTGALYALAALGVSVVYRSSRVLNFALPGVGTLAAYVGWRLQQHHVPYLVVALVVVVVAAAVSILVYECYMRWMSAVDTLTLSVATLGVLLVLQGIVVRIWGTQPKALKPSVSGSFRVGDTHIPVSDVVALAVVAVCTAALFWFTAKTRVGAAIRAASSGPITAQLLGISLRRNQLIAWGISGALAGVAALFVIPNLSLDPNVYVTFIMVGFAAVVMGGFLSPTGVLASGVGIGVVTSWLATYATGTLSATFTFVVIGVVLVFRPHGLFGAVDRPVVEPSLRGGAGRTWRWLAVIRGATRPPHLTARTRLVAGLVVFVVIAAVLGVAPLWADMTLVGLLSTSATQYIAIEGAGILAGDSGRLSLGHGGLMAVGAYTAGYVTLHAHVAFVTAVVVGVLAGALVGAVIGVVTSRMDGVYLAVFTLAFALAVPEMTNTFGSITGGSNGLSFTVPTAFFDVNQQYHIMFVCALVVAAGVSLLRRTRIGRSWRVVRDSPSGARAVGYNTFLVRVGAFTLSAALAAFGGVLSAASTSFIAPTTFGAFLSIYLVVGLVIGGRGSTVGALIGAGVITLLPYYAGSGTTPQLIYGVVVLILIPLAPDGLTEFVRNIGLRAIAAVHRSPQHPSALSDGATRTAVDMEASAR